ncbi:hypothetical protein HWV62_30719 [Athelia sp. TMB]|nr:hypothetical protein HWV62_30719 [Athelia sp. TMB]
MHNSTIVHCIPLEIWEIIFGNACTDSGYTGHSLSQVSHLFRAASEAVKYQSMVLQGPDHLVAFASIISRTPAHLRRVRHLYMTDEPRPKSRNTNRFLPIRSVAHKPRETDTTKLEKVMGDAVWMILEGVSFSIEILRVDFSWNIYDHDKAIFPSCPRLGSLTSDGQLLSQNQSKRTILDKHTPLFPQLRRWHLTTQPKQQFEGQFFSCLPDTAPNLTHLRVPGTWKPTKFLYDLRIALGMADQRSQPGQEPITALPSNVKRVYVKPSVKPQTLAWGGGPSPYSYLIAVLRKMNDHGDGRFVLLPSYQDNEEARRPTVTEWIESIRDEEVVWGLRSRVEPKLPSSRSILQMPIVGRIL